MPNFPKNKGYKMKGSDFYGHGNSSPAKVSDSALVEAQAKLNHTELDFREPGWAKVAKSIHEGAKKPIEGAAAAVAGGGKGGGNAEADATQKVNVQDIVSKTGDLDSE
jgi:hypothetical protein